jgi:hypothetical protein
MGKAFAAFPFSFRMACGSVIMTEFACFPTPLILRNPFYFFISLHGTCIEKEIAAINAAFVPRSGKHKHLGANK